jgi:heat shock protein HslJ
VIGEPPVYAVLGYMDPEEGSDYDATTATAIPDADGRFTLDCQALAPGKKAVLRVVYLQANGVASGFLSRTPYRYPYSVAADGSVDVSEAVAALKPRERKETIPSGGGPVAAVETELSQTLKSLAGTEWRLENLCGETVISNAQPSLTFAADGAISGRGGVNRFRGRITVEDKTLKVGPLMSTRMAGPPGAMTQETKYLKALEAATAIEVAGEILRVTCGGHDKPLVFRKAGTP